MFKKILKTLLAIIVACTEISAQTSANFSLTVNSGSDVFFNFNNFKEYENGKILPYSTILKLEYVGQTLPGKFKLYGKTLSDDFDGPSQGLNSSNLKVKVTGLRSETVTAGEYGNDDEKTEIGKEKNLSATENTLLLIITLSKTAQENSAKYNCFYITLQFSMIPEDGVKLQEYDPGFYSNYACFYVETDD